MLNGEEGNGKLIHYLSQEVIAARKIIKKEIGEDT